MTQGKEGGGKLTYPSFSGQRVCILGFGSGMHFRENLSYIMVLFTFFADVIDHIGL